NKERSQAFSRAVSEIRSRFLRRVFNVKASEPWERFIAETDENTGLTKEPSPDVMAARVGALIQIVATEPSSRRQGLAQYLGGIKQAEATRALAKLAIFSLEPEVRLAALESLKDCAKPDATEVLLQGLRYPWPAVVENAAKAVVELGRRDLLP